MPDGNVEQLFCLLTFKYLAFTLEFSQELLKLKFTIYEKHEPKTKVYVRERHDIKFELLFILFVLH